MIRNPPDNAMNAKSAENALMISPEPFLPDITNPSKCGYYASISWGLNLSNNQISKELDLNRGDAHKMAAQLCEGVVKKSLR